MKFAYLILAHDNFRVLEKLVGMLDDSRNDIFVHFDRKLAELPDIRPACSNLHILRDRVDVRWGTDSQIKALYRLYREAYSCGNYDFFFVISGTHLPLKSQDFIHKYFEKYKACSVIRKWNFQEGEADFKIRRIHFLISDFQSRNRIRRTVVQRIWCANMFVQRVLGVKILTNEHFVKADEWAVICPGHMRFLLENESRILKKYRYSFCGDEFYLASELLNFDGEHVIDDQKLLFVQFPADRPRVIEKSEYAGLEKSEFLFARKFSDGSV